MQGKIVKGIGGRYSVACDGEIYVCKPRGAFRHEKQTVLVGDDVQFNADGGNDWRIDKIETRKNSMVRPPVANIDCLVIVASVAPPVVPAFMIDKMTAIAVHKGIEPVVCINKCDAVSGKELCDIYKNIGMTAFPVSAETGDGTDELADYLSGKVSAFTGASGVGKSSLINRIFSDYCTQTGEISERIGRGKNTTRHVELFPMKNGGYIADTPGFTSLDIEKCEVILKDELPYAFPEFEQYIPDCRWTSCTHTVEKGCAVLDAVNEGKIAQSRHESYKAMYESAKNIKEWTLK